MALTELADGTLLNEDGTVHGSPKAAPVVAVTVTKTVAEIVETPEPKPATRTVKRNG